MSRNTSVLCDARRHAKEETQFWCANSFTQFGCLLVDAEDLALFNAKCGAVSLLVGFY